MSIETNGVNTNNGDSTITPTPKSRYSNGASDSSSHFNTRVEQTSDNSESSLFQSSDLVTNREPSLRELSFRSNTKRYLSVPPLSSNIYAFPKVLDTHSSSSEFQALHPQTMDANQYEARVSKHSISPGARIDRPNDVIDISYHPDPYRALKQPSESTSNKVAILESTNSHTPTDRITAPSEIAKPKVLSQSQDRPTVNRSSDAILGASYRYLNTQPWQNSEYSQYVDKSLAGASSVSTILQEQGYDYANSGSTANLAKKLLVNGWQLVPRSKAQAGDIIFGGKKGGNWRTDRGRSDIGIVGTNGSIFHNDAGSGEWRLNKESRVFPKGQYGDQVWVLRAPEQGTDRRYNEVPRAPEQRQERLPSNIDPADLPNYRRDLDPRNSHGESQYRCYRNCRYFDDFRRRQQGRPKSYFSSNQEAAAAGARDGKRAYEEMRRRNSQSRDRNFQGYRFDDANSQSAKDKNIENPKKYWNDYWKNYWKDYWRDYYSRNKDASDNRHNPNNVHRGDHGRSIHEAAKSKIGQSVWQSSPHANILKNGKLGSASSVGQILKSLGYNYADSPAVAGLAKQLLSAGWTPVKLTELRPGDVLYGAKTADWEKGGGNSHMSIVGSDGMVLHNDSNTGKFQAHRVGDVYDQATYGNRIWALRPPADGPNSRPAYNKRGSDATDGGQEYRRPSDSRRNIVSDVVNGFKNIVSAALTSVGKQMYRPMLSYAMGRLGCAASVSGVLKKAGFSYANHAGVYGLTQQLRKNGWTKHPVSEAQPGDVIYGIRRSSWKNGGGGSHIGIVGEGNTSYHNSSARRHWIKDSLSRWSTSRYRLGVYVLRPPRRA